MPDSKSNKHVQTTVHRLDNGVIDIDYYTRLSHISRVHQARDLWLYFMRCVVHQEKCQNNPNVLQTHAKKKTRTCGPC